MNDIIYKCFCLECKKEINDINPKICPFCGKSSFHKTVEVTENSALTLREDTRVKLINTSMPSRKKKIYEVRQGAVESNQTRSGYAQRTRVIDKANNVYIEKVSTEEGETLHFCQEPLSKHQGHGSAKKTKQS